MYQLEKMPLMVFAQYLEIEFRDLQLVLSRWVTYKRCVLYNCKV